MAQEPKGLLIAAVLLSFVDPFCVTGSDLLALNELTAVPEYISFFGNNISWRRVSHIWVP